MTNMQAMSRPVGWWLKEADARLDAAFDRSLAGRDVDRRGWQVLATLARRSTPREEVVASLAAFDSPAAVEVVVQNQCSLGWIEEDGGLLWLTADGEREHVDLAPLIEGVRVRVAAVLPPADYNTLARLLERLVAAL